MKILDRYYRKEESVLEKKFKELYLAGEIEFEEIDDYVENGITVTNPVRFVNTSD